MTPSNPSALHPLAPRHASRTIHARSTTFAGVRVDSYTVDSTFATHPVRDRFNLWQRRDGTYSVRMNESWNRAPAECVDRVDGVSRAEAIAWIEDRLPL